MKGENKKKEIEEKEKKEMKNAYIEKFLEVYF